MKAGGMPRCRRATSLPVARSLSHRATKWVCGVAPRPRAVGRLVLGIAPAGLIHPSEGTEPAPCLPLPPPRQVGPVPAKVGELVAATP